MINSLEDLEALLRGTELEESTKAKLDIPESSNCAFAIKVNADNALRAWSLLRSLVDETERYPLLAGEPYEKSADWTANLTKTDYFSRQDFRYEVYHSDNENCSPEAIIERFKKINLAQELEEQQKEEAWPSIEEALEQGIHYTSVRFGIAPSIEDILTALEPQLLELDYVPNRAIVQIEKCFFDWELEHLAPDIALTSDPDYLYLDWYELGNTRDYPLFLLPTVNSWEALAYIHWFGTDRSELMIALLESWHKRFQAELVVHDGLALLFNVHQKPSTPNEAFEVAAEHMAFAGTTLNLPGISIRDHARSLLHVDRWYLWSKP